VTLEPRRLESWEMWAFRMSYRAWRVGHVLPDDGGLLDQAATWVEAMTIVDQRLSQIESDEIESHRRKAAKR